MAVSATVLGFATELMINSTIVTNFVVTIDQVHYLITSTSILGNFVWYVGEPSNSALKTAIHRLILAFDSLYHLPACH